MRDNVQAGGPEDYFRKSITVPFLYCTLNEMKTRFTNLPPPEPLWFHLLSIIENIAPLSEPPNQRGSTGVNPWPVLFNVFINDIFHFVQDSTIYNYADDNTLSYSDTNINTVR